MPLLPGSPPVEITLRRSDRARRLSLRVSGVDGRVTLTLPRRMREAEAMEFARSKADWIRAALDRRPAFQRVAAGARIPLEGRMVALFCEAGRRRAAVDGDRLLLPGPDERAAARAAAFLRQVARDRLAAACDGYAGALGRSYAGLTLRDTRSRWGSCTAAGGLMFSWRLVMAPPDVLDYVAAHEVAHLVEMNHSPAFWAVVERLKPGWRAQRHWLRQEGATLHAWRFEG